MSEIEFQDECHYNHDRKVIEFQAWEKGRELVCEISAEAMAARLSSNPADECACIAAFGRHRREIHEIAKRLITVGAITRAGRVLISKVMFEG